MNVLKLLATIVIKPSRIKLLILKMSSDMIYAKNS